MPPLMIVLSQQKPRAIRYSTTTPHLLIAISHRQRKKGLVASHSWSLPKPLPPSIPPAGHCPHFARSDDLASTGRALAHRTGVPSAEAPDNDGLFARRRSARRSWKLRSSRRQPTRRADIAALGTVRLAEADALAQLWRWSAMRHFVAAPARGISPRYRRGDQRLVQHARPHAQLIIRRWNRCQLRPRPGKSGNVQEHAIRH